MPSDPKHLARAWEDALSAAERAIAAAAPFLPADESKSLRQAIARERRLVEGMLERLARDLPPPLGRVSEITDAASEGARMRAAPARATLAA